MKKQAKIAQPQKANETSNELSDAQKYFCEEYTIDWNASRAYSLAYPDASKETCRAGASRLLTNDNIQLYIKEIQKDIEKRAGISRLRVLNELSYIAFSSIAHLHNTWIELKDFDALTSEQKKCIESIDTKVIKKEYNDEVYATEYVKIKLHDKTKALEMINKMLGYNEAERIDHTTKGESINETKISKADIDSIKEILKNDF